MVFLNEFNHTSQTENIEHKVEYCSEACHFIILQFTMDNSPIEIE